MSATGRKKKNGEKTERNARDFYPTPAWCTELLCQELVDLKGASVLEPCMGDGAIVRVLQSYTSDIDWCELSRGRDFFEYNPDRTFDFVITNPPYTLAEDFIEKSLQFADCVAMLLRLNILGGQLRFPWWPDHKPTAIFILSKRPSFNADGSTDACEYAWFIFDKTGKQKTWLHWLMTEEHQKKIRKKGKKVLPKGGS